MEFLAAAFGLLAGFLLGLCILVVSLKVLSFEDILLAPLLGLGVISTLLFVQGSLGVSFAQVGAVALGAVICAFAILVLASSKATLPGLSLSQFRAPRSEVVAFALIVSPAFLILSFVVYFATYPIVIFYDNIAYAAKSVFLSGVLPQHVSLSPMEYTNAFPMAYPLQGVWFYLLNGAFSDALLRILPPLYYATFIVAVVAFSRRFTPSIGMAVLAITLVFSNQNAVFMVEDINANAALAVYSTISLYYAASWLSGQDRRRLVLAGTFAALAAFSRYQGLFLVVSMLLAVVLFSKTARIRSGISFLAGPIVILAPFYLRNAAVFGNPIYPFYGPIFGSGFGFLPSAAMSVSVLLSTSIAYWSIPVLVFFMLAYRFLRSEPAGVRFLYVSTACYSILIIIFGWGLAATLVDWTGFLPILVPMCVLATVPFRHAGRLRTEAALAFAFLLAGLVAEYVVNLIPYFGSVSFSFAVGVTTFSLGFLLLRGRKFVDGWAKPASVVFFLILLVFPAYAAANLKFVTVSVNQSPYSLTPQLYINFSERATQNVILSGKSIITLHDLNVVYLWANSNLPESARILNPLSPPLANRYYSNLNVVPLDGYELASLRQSNATCALVTQLGQKGIDYLVAPALYSNSSDELGLILQGTAPVFNAGSLVLRSINSC